MQNNDDFPSTEAEIHTRLQQVAVLQRRTQRIRRELDEKWMQLVAERIQLQHALDTFEIARAEGVIP